MRVLEPCAGDGVFIEALLKKELELFINSYELNPEAFSFLAMKYADFKDVCVKHADTLIDEELTLFSSLGGAYNRIIANPPYGGWQDYDKRKKLKKLYGDIYVKETYSLFLIRCIKLLLEHGRLVFIIPDTYLNLHMHTELRKLLLTNTKLIEIALFPSAFFPDVNFGYSNLSIITLEKSDNLNDCLNNVSSV